jgi:hypothetical protein
LKCLGRLEGYVTDSLSRISLRLRLLISLNKLPIMTLILLKSIYFYENFIAFCLNFEFLNFQALIFNINIFLTILDYLQEEKLLSRDRLSYLAK